MSNLDDKTATEILEMLKADTPLNKARQVFSFSSAGIEQAGLQRTPISPIEVRREEFKAVAKIAETYGLPAESLMADDEKHVMHFIYKNYRGEVRERKAFPLRFSFEANEWHKTPQWLLHGIDAETGQFRTFAFADMKMVKEKVSDENYVTPASCETIENLKKICLERKEDKPWYGDGDDSPKVVLTTDMVLSLIAAIEGQVIEIERKKEDNG